MTWQRHRARHPRLCDHGIERHWAEWNLVRPGYVTEYLCEVHALRAAVTYGVEPPPRA